MPDDAAAHPPDLSSVRIRRARLRLAGADLEVRLAAALPGRVAGWTSDVAAAVDELVLAWARHVELTEGRDGLFGQIVADAPRLFPAVARLRREHEEIMAGLAGAQGLLAAGGREAEHIRDTLTALLAAISRHRQRGADTIYQAYHIDIGGE